jgi:hypothetical protein
MKHLLVLASLTLAVSAFAQNTVEGTVNGQAQADNAGNTQAITFSSPADAKSTIKSAPPVSGPPLVSSNDTCMGSLSGGVSVVGVGLSGGTTYESESCVALKEGRELWNWGLRDAAIARLCMQDKIRQSMELAGRDDCPQTRLARKTAAAPSMGPVATSPRGNR